MSEELKSSNKRVFASNKDIIKHPSIFMKDELWVDVIGASKYQVSNLGRLKHKKRKACYKACRAGKGAGVEVVAYIQDSGVRARKSLGHLVAEHFVDNPNNYKYIRYVDKDFLNNVASNIQYTECRVEHNNTVRMDDTGRTCTRCNNFLSWDNFCYSKKGIRDKHHVCNNCCCLYELDNKEMLQVAAKKYYEANKEDILIKCKELRLANIEKRKITESAYRESRSEFIKFRLNNRRVRYSLFDGDFTVEEEARESTDGDLEVRCTNCKEYFKPSYPQAASRRYALNSDSGAENRFYCSDKCKKSCSIYKVRDYPRGSKIYKDSPRSKEIRDMAIDRDGYKCQICDGNTKLEVHHIIPYIQNPMIADDLDNVITLCRECHKKIHKEIPGCGYADIKGCKL